MTQQQDEYDTCRKIDGLRLPVFHKNAINGKVSIFVFNWNAKSVELKELLENEHALDFVHFTDELGRTALHLAALFGHVDVCYFSFSIYTKKGYWSFT